MHLAGLDVGTTGCKAVIFDRAGRMLGIGFQEYDVDCREPGMAEQDANGVWAKAKLALREAVAKSGIKEVAALSLSVQGDAIIPLDASLEPIYPALLGMDYRSASQAEWCSEHLGAWDLFARTGMRPHPMNSAVKAMWLRDARPEVYSRAKHIVTYADFVTAKLTGELAIDLTMASRTMAFDLNAGEWSGDLMSRMGLERSHWSRAVPSGTVIGKMRSSLAEEIGLTGRPAIVAGAHDQPCATIGAGVVREGLGVISTGTAEVLSTAFDRLALTREMFESYYPCYMHAAKGMFFTFALNHVGGILLKWFRDNFGQEEVRRAAEQGCSPYALLDASMPDGPSQLLVVPHWNGSGTPTCDLRAKGAIVGWTMASTRADMAKALIEGLAFELLINLGQMQKAGVTVRELVAAGGGSKSPVWLQVKADILNRPIRTLACTEAACLGAALLAGTAVGAYASLDEAVSATVRMDREYLPRNEMATRYGQRFATYQKLYPALRETNLEL